MWDVHEHVMLAKIVQNGIFGHDILTIKHLGWWF